MYLYQTQELPNLVRLCLASHVLQVDEFGHAIAREDVMASAGPSQREPETLDQPDHVFEGYVVQRAFDQASQELSAVQ